MASGHHNSSSGDCIGCAVLRDHGYNEPLYRGSIHIQSATTKNPIAIREEFYKTYDPTTGVRIAATLGGLIGFFCLFLLYKTKCKGRRRRKYTKSVVEEPSDAAIPVDVHTVLADKKMMVANHLTSNNIVNAKGSAALPYHHSENFRSYAHFQARLSDGSCCGMDGAVSQGYYVAETPPSVCQYEGLASGDGAQSVNQCSPQTKETPLSLASFHSSSRRGSRFLGEGLAPGSAARTSRSNSTASHAANSDWEFPFSYSSSPRNPSLSGDQLLREWGLLPNSRRESLSPNPSAFTFSSKSGSGECMMPAAVRKLSTGEVSLRNYIVHDSDHTQNESICLIVPSLDHPCSTSTNMPGVSETKC